MRFYAVGSLVLLLAGCGAKYKPVGPVLEGYERSFRYPVHRPHEGLTYNGRAPATSAPVVPLLAFGAAFDLDFAVMPKNSDFDMLEFARVSFPDKYVWVALETSAATGDQTLLANLDQIDAFMPELPLARQSVNLQADDRSTEFTVDVSLSYPNSKGQKVEAEITGDPPLKTGSKRNGRTFTHSQNQLLAVLDVAATESLFKADVRIDGQNVPFRKVAGIVPGQFVLQQTQGGLASGAFSIVPTTPAVGGADFGVVAVSAAAGAPAPEPEATKPPPELQVRMGVAKNFPSIQDCYTKRLADKADVKGRMQFDFEVQAGKVLAPAIAKIEAEDALADDILGACVVGAMASWTFDESVTGTISWPFVFEPAAEGVEPMVKIGEGAVDLAEPAAPAEGAPAEGAPAEGGAEALPGDDLLGEEDPDSAATRPQEMGAAALSSFSTVHQMQSGSEVTLQWLVSRTGDRVVATQTTDLRTLTYSYRIVQDNFLELVSINVEQYGRATPVTSITFNPPVPDVRWPFNGRRNSSFVIDVNGQQNFATGEVEAYWTESGPKVKVVPTAPEWAASRPLLTSITYADGQAAVKIERTGE